jgi:sporulation protein YlmC with PRC-barrel domain
MNKQIHTVAIEMVIAISLLACPSFARAETGGNAGSSSTAGDRALEDVERADHIVGREVRNNKEKIGKIDDLVIDLESGRVLYSVISIGGFLGIGDHFVAVPVGALIESNTWFRLPLDKQQLLHAPQYSHAKDAQSRMSSPEFLNQLERLFGENEKSSDTGEAMPSESVGRLSDLKGLPVRNISHQKIGNVETVIVDMHANRVPYVIVTPDRNIGLQGKLLALPPNALMLSPNRKVLNTGINNEQLSLAPSFESSSWPDFSNIIWGTRVYQFYGHEPYFGGSSLQPTSRTNGPTRIYHEPQK